MKVLCLFSFFKSNSSRGVSNYNKPLQNYKYIPNNMNYIETKKATTAELLTKITERILKILAVVEENNRLLLKDLENLSKIKKH